MRGTHIPTKRSEAVTFAREWARRQGQRSTVAYHLAYPNGGGVPFHHDAILLSTPRTPAQYDCVGAVCAILAIDRVQGPPWRLYFDKKLGYGYMNCDTIIKDAQGANVNFTEVKGQDVKVGDIVVFGSKFPGRHGHIGFLSGGAQVVHCSPSNTRKLGHALAETSAGIFLNRKDRIYVRYNHWQAE